ncbi:uncharacterized protein PV09_04006 [Verruconis gallopava]|uniref:Glycosyl hydrolase family 92 domain-containing protein n=1 Tax=Verruconis gallopava TaxID=253628 RepID=A0A0D1YVU9_9PEZI|nr:uncharacterized protein PV09_04006 [Verruconis gallopava]KIW04822.1 hypothetical protein PV09_04006 [Verruconis gallopava]
MIWHTFISFLVFLEVVRGEEQFFDPLRYVDPLIGSANDGHVFAGASLPYGMAKPVADTNNIPSVGPNNQGGFVSNDQSLEITGFSSMHDSGTGGSPSLGNFPIFPQLSCLDKTIGICNNTFTKTSRKVQYISSSVKAVPGYFSLILSTGIRAKMTSTQHTSLFSFSFEEDQRNSPLILLDLTDLSDSRQNDGAIFVDQQSGRMVGGSTFKPSFGIGTYKAFFCIDFSGGSLMDSGTFVENVPNTAIRNLTVPPREITNGFPIPEGAWVRFIPQQNSTIFVRAGLSFISETRACENAETEIPDFDFEKTMTIAQNKWRSQLAPIEVSTRGLKNSTLVTNFYSGIYRTMVNPQDYTGENPLWKSKEPYFDSFYCLWDSFRSQLPFLTIIDPKQVARIIRSLIDTYKHEGWLPDCRMSLCKGFTQGGSNADIVLADAFVKGIRDDINWQLGYKAVVKDAEVEPYDWCCEGRGNLESWKKLGYVPIGDFDVKGYGTLTRSISRTLEYSYNDFCVAQIATGMDSESSDILKYLRRSKNWMNLFREDIRSSINGFDTGFVGFFQPKYTNLSWSYQDPIYCSNIDTNPSRICSLQPGASETYESSIWEYSFFVPHDQASLITKLGGPDEFVRRLDYLHDRRITLISNEPSFLTVFQYHYAGRPALSTKRVHFYIPSAFKPTRAGLPGNDDSGAMGSFLAFAMIGLFPNPGQDVYLITTPFFERVSIRSPINNKTATISVVNFDPDYEDIYIQSATLDGVAYSKNWIDHSFFLEGKELILTVGKNESSWGTKLEDLPPSLSAYESANR